ncbi:hypothetical protein G9A89_015812, partial [Geosiphon pyriformis]
LGIYLHFAIKLAKECGQLILDGSKARYTAEKDFYEKYGNPIDLVTETDKKVEQLVRSKLGAEYPKHRQFVLQLGLFFTRFIGEEIVATGEKCELTKNQPGSLTL